MNDYELALITIGDYELQRRKLVATVQQLQEQLDKKNAEKESK